ncbi:MAG: bifunctional proline dehydrogenase/L-glutamate gamma-semialdehyde dehydrogenase PutA [Pseudomonadaceae bacterium]|nr:bifunctional proline dehydrogenase/L-glutamate gamma-semialdehyde dehydrogenase PutA [Pseudomonadaceae bacterium]
MAAPISLPPFPTASEQDILDALIADLDLDTKARRAIVRDAASLVERIRRHSEPTLMEAFLSEYGLSTDEGVALMCLAEALLRVPDADTIDDLIVDKITASDWDAHAGGASSVLVNASTWALMLTGRVLTPPQEDGMISGLRGVVRRMGEPLVRRAISQAMREMGKQFVLGENIHDALKRGEAQTAAGYTYSFDMLGEGARTDADARRYHLAYADAITEIAPHATGGIADNPGISVKLSALHPRYDVLKSADMLPSLIARLRSLAVLAAGSNIGLNVDAEEDDRLEVSLAVIEAVLSEPALANWQGFGVVIQAYSRRAADVIDWVAETAERLDRRLMVRLVKGAYWDTEIKHAQQQGHDAYAVFTRKAATDVSYLACAARLLRHRRWLYPQFATHNAHTVCSVNHLAVRAGISQKEFEFQRLHGMGEALHEFHRDSHGGRCRIYAPVGAHRDLLAYLVRRLLENGANSSFVNQLTDADVSAAEIAADPLDAIGPKPSVLPGPGQIFPGRQNSSGWNLYRQQSRELLWQNREAFADTCWFEASAESADGIPVFNPSDPEEIVGYVVPTTVEEVTNLVDTALIAQPQWQALSVNTRSQALCEAANLYERHTPELCALLGREAGKTISDCIDEVREAVDFLRYYARQAQISTLAPGRGVFACISPWNFPLAIFTGQIAAALAAGNTVVAKPAEQTSLIAARAVELLHAAGVEPAALQLAQGDGRVGAALTANPSVNGVCFTGSLETARLINISIAQHLDANAAFIAETGGLNTMIVDSTALAEQAVSDIISSAFQSAGQRCSALRMLYLQNDVADHFLTMLKGAMDELTIADPWLFNTDVGPIIDAQASTDIRDYLNSRVVSHQTATELAGNFVAPTVIEVNGIEDLPFEVFGPVLHIARFEANALDDVIDAINASGYGLTAGLHTRLDDRVQHVVDRLRVGNLYVNRNQIGAVVEAQPFGGEGLSGTGPKAGGPNYLPRFTTAPRASADDEQAAMPVMPVLSLASMAASIALLDNRAWSENTNRSSILERCLPKAAALPPEPLASQSMPGPTGEDNTLRVAPRGVVLCLGPTFEAIETQVLSALRAGCSVLVCSPEGDATIELIARLAAVGAPIARLIGWPSANTLTALEGLAAVACYARDEDSKQMRRALAERDGPIVRWIAEPGDVIGNYVERHVSTDTTAAGGNTTLMAMAP